MKRILLFIPLVLAAQTLPPDADRQLARDIFKEFIETRSGYTTGATTPVAEAAARAGFANPDEVKLARIPMYFSSEKARGRLGYEPGPVEPALARATAEALTRKGGA